MKEVVNKTDAGQMAVHAGAAMEAWGAPVVSSKDIVIPKIYCMQGLSQLVADEKAKMGDFVDSMTDEIIGSIAKPLAFIPFHLEKVWIISKLVGTDYEFSSIEDVTPANENKLYEEVIDGITYKNEYCMNFYVLRPEDMTLPYVISFKGTSSKAGKILATQMYVRNAKAGKIPPAYVMELSGSKEKNAKGTYVVLSTKTNRESTPEEVAEAFGWFKTVNSGEAKAHQDEAPANTASSEKRF